MVPGKANVRNTERFVKMFGKLPRRIQERALTVLRELRDNPLLGKPLKAEVMHEGVSYRFRSVRIGDYRLIYIYIPITNTVIAYYIGHRRNIYKKLR